jgi:hypothetical protein
LGFVIPSAANDFKSIDIKAAVRMVNKVNQLVTPARPYSRTGRIFAGHLDSLIEINNRSKYLIPGATSGSGQINVQMTLIPFAEIF